MPAASTPTKERIVEEAMRLFSEKGYKGASITQIEAASGLSPGAGGLYRHFKSKEELLAAGVQRHLDRLDALREIRQIFSAFGDLREQLEITARYFLEELESQSELLQVIVLERQQRPKLLSRAVDNLIASTYRGFAEWLCQVTGPELSDEQATRVAILALNSLLASQLLRKVVGVDALALDDESMVATWVDMVVGLLPD